MSPTDRSRRAFRPGVILRVAALIATLLVAACSCESHVSLVPLDGDDREREYEDGYLVYYLIEGEQLTYAMEHVDDTGTSTAVRPIEITSTDESVFTIESWEEVRGEGREFEDYATVTILAHQAGEALIHFEMGDYEIDERIVVVSSPAEVPYPDN